MKDRAKVSLLVRVLLPSGVGRLAWGALTSLGVSGVVSCAEMEDAPLGEQGVAAQFVDESADGIETAAVEFDDSDDPDKTIATSYNRSGWPSRSVVARADQFTGTPYVHFTYKRLGTTCRTSGTAMTYVPSSSISQTMCASLSGASWNGSYCRTSSGGRAAAYRASFTSVTSTQLNYNVVDQQSSGRARDQSGWIGSNGCARPTIR